MAPSHGRSQRQRGSLLSTRVSLPLLLDPLCMHLPPAPHVTQPLPCPEPEQPFTTSTVGIDVT